MTTFGLMIRQEGRCKELTLHVGYKEQGVGVGKNMRSGILALITLEKIVWNIKEEELL